MRTSLQSASPMMTRINVTPIIDVALVLVIVLLITAPMLSVDDLGVQVPATHSRGLEEERRVTITLGKSAELAVDDEIIALAQLEASLGSRLAEDEDLLVVVRADEGASHGAVRAVLSKARSAGAKRLAIATRQRGGRNP